MSTLEPGDVLAGRYEILAPLGKGGMGSVYRARHRTLDREVALKILEPSLIDDGEARFEREARAIAKLDHPSCVRILDYGRTKRHKFIVMQLLEGQTLAAMLKHAGQLPVAQALQLAKNLLSALVHAHARGVLHRDLKPENVMLVGPGKRAILIDFGLAHLENDAPLTQKGMCIGSPSYLAPERVDGQPHDERSDLYAVGVLLYEMLAGTRPFVGKSPIEIITLARARPPRPLRAIRADISKPLDALVARALAKDPARRFDTAEDMLAALEDLPIVEQMAELAVTAERDEAATTLVNAKLVVAGVRGPSLLARVVSRIRYGRWRWKSA
ncbi:MAG TPA: serine/threonine-protein kinase [Kofleriaceae bacterium]|nr:serine/threonine-protein kinase [Kofleriaceae bacterium]